MWISANPEPKDKTLYHCILELHTSEIYNENSSQTRSAGQLKVDKYPRVIFDEGQSYWIETKWTGGKPIGDDFYSSANRIRYFGSPFEHLLGDNRYQVYTMEGYSCFVIDEFFLERHFITKKDFREKQLDEILC